MKFQHLLQNHHAHVKQTWHKASLGEGYSSLFEWRASSFFFKGDSYKTARIRNLKIFAEKSSADPLNWFQPNLGRSNFGLRSFKFPQMKRYANFKGEMNTKKHCWNLNKSFLFRTTGSISTKLGTKHPCIMGIQVYANRNHSILKKEITGFSYPNYLQIVYDWI